MKEQVVYGRIRPYLSTWGKHTRVENAASPGFPDIHYCINGTQGVIETKVEKAGQLFFEKFQIPWIARYGRAGIRHAFLITSPDESDKVFIYDYTHVVQVPRIVKGKWSVVMAKDLTPLLILTRPYDWDSLRLLLTR